MTTLHKNLSKLWPLVNKSDKKAVPTFCDNPIEALMTFFNSIQNDELKLLPPDIDEYAYLRLMLSVGNELEIIVPVCGLIRFCTPWWKDVSFYIDSVPDKKKNHRVYVRDEEFDEGEPMGAFLSIEDAVHHLVQKASKVNSNKEWSSLDDKWEQGPSSGAYILEHALVEDICSLWKRAAQKEWRVSDETQPEVDTTDRTPGWQRRFCFSTFKAFVATMELDVPKEIMKLLSPSQKDFMRHLLDLKNFLDGEIPKILKKASSSKNTPLAAKAAQWLEQNVGKESDASLAASPTNAPSKKAAKFSVPDAEFPEVEATEPVAEEAEDPFAQQLRPLLKKILEVLSQQELIEFEPEKKELLYKEMTEAAAKSRHPKALLKAVMYALIKSDNVEEIYGSDSELMMHIKKAIW